MRHSFGGMTTYLVTAIEPRVKVAVPMAPVALANSTLPAPRSPCSAPSTGW
jgi:hypothetical protein